VFKLLVWRECCISILSHEYPSFQNNTSITNIFILHTFDITPAWKSRNTSNMLTTGTYIVTYQMIKRDLKLPVFLVFIFMKLIQEMLLSLTNDCFMPIPVHV